MERSTLNKLTLPDSDDFTTDLNSTTSHPSKQQMKLSLILVAAYTFSICTTAAGSVITDGDFTNWSFNQSGADGGSATVTREVSDGNPGARLNITTDTGSTAQAVGTAIKNDFVTFSNIEGTGFELTFDVLSGPGGFGDGQGISLLVEQNGSIYAESLGSTDWEWTEWETLSFTGTFSEGNFGLLIGPGPANPDFDGGVATRFGFSGSNSISGTLTNYYDNFQLSGDAIVGSSPVPEPSSLLIFGASGLALLIASRRYRLSSRPHQQ